MAECQQKMQGLLGNPQHAPEVKSDKKWLNTKIKGTDNRNIRKPVILRTY